MEVRVCREDELVAGVVRTVDLGRDQQGRPFVALLLRDERGAVVAYRNMCRHLPVPLDGGTGRFLSEDRAHLICGTHGAIYRLDDGHCVEGPCAGRALHKLRVRRRGHHLYVSSEPTPALGR